MLLHESAGHGRLDGAERIESMSILNLHKTSA